MGQSLQDQLLQAGIAKPKQAKKARQDKTKRKKAARKSGQNATAEEQALSKKVAADDAARREADRRRAQAANAERAQRERAAQAKQIVEDHRVAIDKPAEDDPPYSYNMNGRIRRLPVSRAQRQQLANGQLAIVRHFGDTSLVDRETAERLETLIPKKVWRIVAQPSEPDPDDPYAGYEVPDDLMW
ncbi:DUF2058 family protein [Salinisphaera sp. SPP-AMP-43]|uniref:DUF2058 family protein n=1 Tax=Salinisphaera sp. SPP-AMP-43 TaxID=3121288 RepID=UPI003C6E014A